MMKLKPRIILNLFLKLGDCQPQYSYFILVKKKERTLIALFQNLLASFHPTDHKFCRLSQH